MITGHELARILLSLPDYEVHHGAFDITGAYAVPVDTMTSIELESE